MTNKNKGEMRTQFNIIVIIDLLFNSFTKIQRVKSMRFYSKFFTQRHKAQKMFRNEELCTFAQVIKLARYGMEDALPSRTQERFRSKSPEAVELIP